VCGVLGIVAVMLYYQKSLNFMLAHFLYSYVLWRGIVLLGLAGARSVFLWSSAGHHFDCAHEHGWKPWRYIVLCLPIMLFFLGLPNQGFSSAKAIEVEDSDLNIKDRGGNVIHLDFRDLERWAFDEGKREWSEGRPGELKGQFVPGQPGRFFNLVRYKIPCCTADAIPIRVVVLYSGDVSDIRPNAWMEVTGQIQYRKQKDRDKYVPVLQLRSRQDIVPTDPENPPYVQ